MRTPKQQWQNERCWEAHGRLSSAAHTIVQIAQMHSTLPSETSRLYKYAYGILDIIHETKEEENKKLSFSQWKKMKGE